MIYANDFKHSILKGVKILQTLLRILETAKDFHREYSDAIKKDNYQKISQQNNLRMSLR